MAQLRSFPGVARFLLLGLVFASMSGVSGVASTQLPESVVDLLQHREYSQAIRALQPLAGEGNSEAQYQLGRLHQRGLGVKRSEQQALAYFERAARTGHVEAAYLMGSFYQRGAVAAKDEQLAAHWFGIAASSGHQMAQRRLAQLSGVSGRRNSENRTVAASGRLPLCAAVEDQDLVAVKRLINTGADVGARDANGAGVLHCGVRSGSEAVARVLLDAGAAVDVADASGDTPLHIAVASGAVTVARMLMQAGADPGTKNAADWSPRMLAERGGDAAMMRLLGAKSGSRHATLARLDVAAKSSGKEAWSRLALASWSGEVDLVEALIKQGAAINSTDRSGRTAVYRAVQANRQDVLKLLVKHGADLTSSSDEGTLLHVALQADHVDVANILLANAALQNVADPQGETPLLLAIRLENSHAAKLLLKHGADVNGGEVPAIVAAAKYGLAPVVQALLDAGSQPNTVDRMGRSALWWTAESGAVEIARSLIMGGADNLPDTQGVAPWHVSAMAGNLAMLELLEATVMDLNEPTASGSTALLLASENGNLAIVESLLARGSKVDVKNKVGDTALICAVRNAHKEVATVLISSGANPRMRNAQDMSALELAERSKDPDWSEILKDQRGWFDVLMSDA